MWLRCMLGVGLIIGMGGCASVERDQTTGEYVADSAITTRVKARLVQDPGVSALAISVETLNGVVLLRGFVDNDAQREKALAVARSVGGVREVNGEGLVVRPQRPSN